MKCIHALNRNQSLAGEIDCTVSLTPKTETVEAQMQQVAF